MDRKRVGIIQYYLAKTRWWCVGFIRNTTSCCWSWVACSEPTSVDVVTFLNSCQ